jgi:hypothetical protein
MGTKRFDPDDEEALARAFAPKTKGRRSKRGRRRAAAPARTRVWWMPSARPATAADAEGTPTKQTAKLPEPPLPDTTNETPELTLNDFLDGLPAQRRIERVEPEDYYDS